MSNISAACSISSHHSVSAALLTASPNPVIGDAIYHLPSPTAKAQPGYHRDSYISPTTNIGTTSALPNLYHTAALNNTTAYGSNEHSARYIPPRL